MKFITILLLAMSLTSCNANSEIISQSKPEMDKHIPNSLKITIGSNTFVAKLANNAAARTFATMMPLTITMNDLNNNEKFYNFTSSLPTSPSSLGQVQNGDLMMFGSNCLVLFYKAFSTSYNYTPIAQITNPKSLESAVGRGAITIKFELLD